MFMYKQFTFVMTGFKMTNLTLRIFLGAYECVAENDKGVGVSEPVKIQVLCK